MTTVIFSTASSSRAPIKLAVEDADVLLFSMRFDGLLTATHRRLILGALASYLGDKLTVSILESLAPCPVYSIFRWLKFFFKDEIDEPPVTYQLIPYMPVTSTLPVIYSLVDLLDTVIVEVPPSYDTRSFENVEKACRSQGINFELRQRPLTLTETYRPCVSRTSEDLLSALGDFREVALGILKEVLESGGAVMARVLLDLLNSTHLMVFKYLIAFDFLRAQPTQSGLIFYLTRKGLEAIMGH
ncbi:MAG: hypothetical protein QW291_06505 [Thermofilaceae archaeon]